MAVICAGGPPGLFWASSTSTVVLLTLRLYKLLHESLLQMGKPRHPAVQRGRLLLAPPALPPALCVVHTVLPPGCWLIVIVIASFLVVNINKLLLPFFILKQVSSFFTVIQD